MSTLGSPAKSYSDVRNINLKGGALGSGLIRWTPPVSGVPALWSTNPFSTDDYGLYVNSSGQLVFSSLGTTTILGSGGGGGIPTWEQIFAADATFAKTTVWTIDNSSGNNQVLKLTNSGAGSGNVLVIDNAGTGYDIIGTAGWFVTKTGASTFLDVDTATVTNTTGNIILKASGAGVVTIGANTNTITMAKATTFSSTITVTDGLTDLISTSNTVDTLRITNNTATTIGAAADDLALLLVRSTSLTTGTAIRAQLTPGALTTGKYFEAWDKTAGSGVWSIGEGGAQVIGGIAGSTVFTITAGDAVLSDGSLALTDADNAATLSVTNDTATTASVVEIAGSGAFTGTTTGSFVEINQSGLTTGTLLRLSAAAATTSVGVVDIAAGTTSGSVLRITTGTATFTTGGKMIELTSTAAVAGNHLTCTTTGAYTGTGMILVTAGAATTGVLVSIISTTGLTTGSLLRATSSTASAIATNGAISFTATGDFTSTSNMGFMNVAAASTAAGTIFSLTGGALTTGVALYLVDGGTGMTTGSLIRSSTATTGAVATNGIWSFVASGNYTSGASTVGAFHVAGAATTAGTIMSILGGAQTTGIALNITDPSTGMTSGSLLRVISATTGAVATNGVVSFQASGAFTSTTIGFVNVIVSGAVAGTGMAIQMSATNQTTGIGLRVDQSNTTTGYTGNLVQFTGTSTTGAANVLSVTSANSTAGTAVLITANSLTTGVGLRVTSSGTITSAGEGLVNIVGTGITTGDALKIDLTEATLNGGFYLRCYDDTAPGTVFTIGEDGATVIAGSALGTAALTLTAGDILITAGNLTAGGKIIFNATETIAAGGTSTALSLTKSLHYVDADAGGDTFTLADGVPGQVTTILMKSSTGTATITPANLAGGTSVTFNAAGDSVILQFMDTDWYIIGGNSYAVV